MLSLSYLAEENHQNVSKAESQGSNESVRAGSSKELGNTEDCDVESLSSHQKCLKPSLSPVSQVSRKDSSIPSEEIPFIFIYISYNMFCLQGKRILASLWKIRQWKRMRNSLPLQAFFRQNQRFQVKVSFSFMIYISISNYYLCSQREKLTMRRKSQPKGMTRYLQRQKFHGKTRRFHGKV